MISTFGPEPHAEDEQDTGCTALAVRQYILAWSRVLPPGSFNLLCDGPTTRSTGHAGFDIDKRAGLGRWGKL
jgi:hypothetical protein